jgi:hypothetical protein
MVGLESNLQLASITTQHKRPQYQIFKNREKVKCAFRFVRALLTNFHGFLEGSVEEERVRGVSDALAPTLALALDVIQRPRVVPTLEVGIDR